MLKKSKSKNFNSFTKEEIKTKSVKGKLICPFERKRRCDINYIKGYGKIFLEFFKKTRYKLCT